MSRWRDAAVAVALLILSDLAVRLLPFALIAKCVRGELRRRNSEPDAAIARVRWAVAAARRRIPWTIPCLAAAVAANRLLAHRGVPSEIHFGVRAAAAAFDAHAWLVAGGRAITGDGEIPKFAPLYSLVTSGR